MVAFHMKFHRSAGYSNGTEKVRSPWITCPGFGLDTRVSKVTLYSNRVKLYFYRDMTLLPPKADPCQRSRALNAIAVQAKFQNTCIESEGVA